MKAKNMKQMIYLLSFIIVFGQNMFFSLGYADNQGQASTQLKPVDLSEEDQTQLILKNDLKESALTEKKNSPVESELKEKDVPLFAKTDPKKDSSTSGSLSWRVILSISLIFVFSLAISLFAKYGTRNRLGRQDQNKIRILSQHHLGPKKSLIIVQVAGESLLVGVTDQNISLIKPLALIDDEIPHSTPSAFFDQLEMASQERPLEDNRNTHPVSTVQDRVSIQNSLIPHKTQISEDIKDTENEEMSLLNLQKRVSERLKAMRSF